MTLLTTRIIKDVFIHFKGAKVLFDTILVFSPALKQGFWCMWNVHGSTLNKTAVSVVAVEYADITFAKEWNSRLTSALGMTLNCIWWWGSSLGALGKNAITSRSTVSQVLAMGQIELFNRFLRIIISHLKLYSFVQIIYIKLEYLINRITNVK